MSRWFSAGVISALIAVTVLSYTLIWLRQQSTKSAQLGVEYKAKSALIMRSQELQAKRQELANRMEKIQELMDDKVLLSLLKNISEGFSGKDCVLEYINIDAKSQQPSTPDKPTTDPRYVVHITGITKTQAHLRN